MFQNVYSDSKNIRKKTPQLRSLDDDPSLAATRTSGVSQSNVKGGGGGRGQEYDRWESSASWRGKLEAEAKQSSCADEVLQMEDIAIYLKITHGGGSLGVL